MKDSMTLTPVGAISLLRASWPAHFQQVKTQSISWMSGGGAIGGVPFLKGIAFGTCLGHNVTSGRHSTLLGTGDVRRWDLLHEVEAVELGTWIGNDNMRRTPFSLASVFFAWEVWQMPEAGSESFVGSRSYSSLSLATMTYRDLLLRNHLFLASLYSSRDGHWESELLAAFATMLGNDDLGLLCDLLRRVSGLIFGCLVWTLSLVAFSCT